MCIADGLLHLQVASFLGELQESGLLSDEKDATDTPPAQHSVASLHKTEQASAAIEGQAAEPASQEQDTAPKLAGEAVRSLEEAASSHAEADRKPPSELQQDQHSEPDEGQAGPQPSANTSQSAANGDSSAMDSKLPASVQQQQQQGEMHEAPASAQPAAEQRVVGLLDGAEDWCEVMDMGSGKVYFWQRSSNQVCARLTFVAACRIACAHALAVDKHVHAGYQDCNSPIECKLVLRGCKQGCSP